jgi:uncharacterized protein
MPRKSEEVFSDFRITIGGKEQRDLVNDLIRVEVEDTVDCPSMFNLTLADGDGSWLDSPLLNPEIGGDIKIYLGYADENLNPVHPLITGKIVALNPSFPMEGVQTLAVQGYDHSFFLQKTHSIEKSTALNGQDLSVLVRRIAQANRLIPKVDNAGIQYSNVIFGDIGESDYSFIKKIADMVGFEFFVRDKMLYFRAPGYSNIAGTLSWGVDIYSMNFRMSTARAAKKAKVLAFNYDDQKLYKSEKDKGEFKFFEGIYASKYLNASEFHSEILEKNSVLSCQKDADVLGGALIDKANNSFVEGSCEISGDPKIKAGSSIKIEGAGRRLSGKYYIKGARHSIGEGGYLLNLDLMSMVTQKVSDKIIR